MRWGSRRGGAKVHFGVGRSIPLPVEAQSPRASHHDYAIENAYDLKIIFLPIPGSVLYLHLDLEIIESPFLDSRNFIKSDG